ncbi:MAG: DNA replication complex GINS family protein [Candidatus Diapherotrites archaeon]|nr:DNA replication complex GINS family protein [Candidatus Diapherotrites archaeon]
MEMTYDEIMKVRRLEKSATRLVKLAPDFYEQIEKFIAKELKKANGTISLDRVREFENLKQAIIDIYNMREKKILNQALLASRSGNADTEHLTNSEKELYENLLLFLNRYRGNVNLYFEKEGGESKKSTPEPLNNVTVSILEDVPSFVGEDMKEYGPFKREEVVELPKSVANLLIARNLAERE